jgi:hypothetical protein
VSCDCEAAKRVLTLERENAMLATDLDLVQEKAKQAFRAEQAAKNKLNNSRRDDPNAAVIRDIADHWRVMCNHPKVVVEPTADDDRWEKVRRRLEHFSVSELKQAINGAARFPYVVQGQGRAETGTRKQRHDDLELICRSPRNVEKFMALAVDEDGEPLEVRLREPVVAARYFDEAIQEAAVLRRAADVLRDMVAMQDAYIARLEAEVGAGVLA